MTIIIIVITAAISFFAFKDASVMNSLIFNPYKTITNKQWYRLVTHGFIHADFTHLLVNMIVLFSFGQAVENIFGMLQMQGIISSSKVMFIALYFGGIIIASLPSLRKQKGNYYYNSLGASGAVSAVVFTSIFFQPLSNIYLFFAIPIPSILFGVAYLAYEHYMAKKGQGKINHDAHFAGAVFGFIFPILLEPKLIFHFLQSIGLGW